jgi:hypothetical protein
MLSHEKIVVLSKEQQEVMLYGMHVLKDTAKRELKLSALIGSMDYRKAFRKIRCNSLWEIMAGKGFPR